MFRINDVKMIILSVCMASMTSLNAKVDIHPFEVESGMVMYEISGGTQLTPETNLSIKGTAKLRFKEWGEVKIEEENSVILTTGAMKYKQNVKRFEKQTKETIITADFENEQLLERKKNSDTDDSNETKGLVHGGQDVIAGIMCTIWEGSGVKKCIHKGIVLKLESQIFDVFYTRVATKVVFDINTSSENCKAPDYPIHEFSLFEGNIKTKNTHKAENFCKLLRDSSCEVSEKEKNYIDYNITDGERQKFINQISQEIYEREKELLPELLLSMKEMRECLQTIDDPFEANQCMEHFTTMKSQLGTEEDDYVILWNEKRKAILLDKIEDELIDLESRMPCVKRSQNITDLSACMK